MKWILILLTVLFVSCRTEAPVAETADIAVIDGEDIADVSPYEFDSVTEDAGNTLTLTADAAIHGTKGYKLTFAGADRDCFGKIALSEPTDVFYRSYQNFAAVSATNGWGYVMTPFWDGIQNILDIKYTYRSGTPAFGLTVSFYTNVSGWITLVDKPAQDVIAINSEYFLEVRFKSAATGGGAECWLNGVLQGSDLNYATSNRLPDSARIGFTSGPAFAAGTVVYIDDGVFNTGPIGEYSILPWQVWNVEEDLLPEISASGNTALDNYEISPLSHVQIADYRGVNKHYNMFGLLLGEEAEL